MARLDNFITQYRDETETLIAQIHLLRDMRQKMIDLGGASILTDAFDPDTGNPDVISDNADIIADDLITASASIEAIYTFARDNGHIASLQVITP